MQTRPNGGTSTAANLIALSLALGARDVPGWTVAEERLVREAPLAIPLFTTAEQSAIYRGEDPLGEAFCRGFSAEERRPNGATYTPYTIVDSMLSWAEDQIVPARVVDPGSGSARFLVAAGRRFPHAELIASELDPLGAILARGHLAAAGMAERSRVFVGDYRQLALPKIAGRTLFLGNPPYVRHHLIDSSSKSWLVKTARSLGHEASQLAGLHVHFFLATAEHAKPGDVGVLITAAEWLDVNYGRLVRELLTGILGAKNIHVIEPTADPFPGTQTTAVITGFEVGAKPDSVGLRRVATLTDLGRLETDWYVHRERLEAADRWTPLTRAGRARREGFVELGELCRVHRGQVTGANAVWIAGEHSMSLPTSVLYPSVTKARELFAAGAVLIDPSILRSVIDLPQDLDQFDKTERRLINKFLQFAQSKGVDGGFIARHRRAWWSVGLREPAPILATYMARRPPTFVRNLADARHINIAHGLYPREPLDDGQLLTLADYLSTSVCVTEGRTYAGGLTKFEPKEMERLLVPRPELLTDPAFVEAGY
jgi:adenine-specific DNA-methyltransferase